jgi:hypothetical protein
MARGFALGTASHGIGAAKVNADAGANQGCLTWQVAQRSLFELRGVVQRGLSLLRAWIWPLQPSKMRNFL